MSCGFQLSSTGEGGGVVGGLGGRGWRVVEGQTPSVSFRQMERCNLGEVSVLL